VDTTQTINHISLCSGYGGIGIGLKRVVGNLRDIAHVEIEAFAIANLVAKMEAGELDACPIWTNLKTFDFSAYRGRVDIISGGYPCQPFSVAGKRRGVEDERHLFPYIAKGIAAARPRFVFFENVEGHLSEGFCEVQESLRALGYAVEAGIFSAAEVGAPHQRKRLFILGVADTEGEESGGLQKRTGEKFTSFSQSGVELGDSQHDGLSTREESRGSKKTIRDIQEGQNEASELEGASELSNSSSFRGGEIQTNRRFSSCEMFISSSDNWPSRPNQEQHEWEEPRTIAKGAKSSLGRTTNGSSSRVDELRMLGNGVVPATAEKAFRTLINKFK